MNANFFFTNSSQGGTGIWFLTFIRAIGYKKLPSLIGIG